MGDAHTVDLALTLPIFALGLAFGSFLNVCIWRLPRGLSVVRPGSACPRCERPIRLYDNVPILSWLILRGRCRDCKARITPRYLFVELLTGFMFLACYAYFGPTLAALKYCVFGFLLLGLIFTDAETQLLPDALTLPGVALGLLFSLVVPVNDLLSRMLVGLVYQPAASGFQSVAVVAASLDGSGGGRFVHLRCGSDLSAGTRRRGHGIRRRQADGDGGRVPRTPAHDFYFVQRVNSGIAGGTVDGVSRVDQTHATAHGSAS